MTIKNIINNIFSLREKNNDNIEVKTYEKLETRVEIEEWINKNYSGHSISDINDDLTVDIYVGSKATKNYNFANIFFLPFKASRSSTEMWLNEYGIKNYTINEDLTVDVDGNVEIKGKLLEFIPIQFGYVKGDFDCSLTALKNLHGFPKKVDGNVSISATDIESLHGITEEIGGNFHCGQNKKLRSLKYGPKEVGGDYLLSFTPINDLKDFYCNIKGEFYSMYEPKPNEQTGFQKGAKLQELKNHYKNTKDSKSAYINSKTCLCLEISGTELNNILTQVNSKKIKYK